MLDPVWIEALAALAAITIVPFVSWCLKTSGKLKDAAATDAALSARVHVLERSDEVKTAKLGAIDAGMVQILLVLEAIKTELRVRNSEHQHGGE